MSSNNNVLNVHKLSLVMEVLQFYMVANASYHNLGLRLGLLHPDLEDIESNHRQATRRMQECLKLWLSTDAPSRTWDRLADAIRQIGNQDAANKIRKTMADPASQLLQQYSDRLSQVVLTKESVQRLHTEGVISQDTADKVAGYNWHMPLDDNPSLIAVCTTVAEDHSKLRVLATVLCRFDQTAKELLDDCERVIPANEAATYTTASRSSKAQPSVKQTMPTERGGLHEETDMGQQEMIEPPPSLPFFNEEEDCPSTTAQLVKFNPVASEDMENGIKVILMTASDKELHAVLVKAKPLEGYREIIEATRAGVPLYLGMYGKCKVAIVQTSQGQHNILRNLPKLLEKIKAQFVISVGVCYGMQEDKVKLGDVIVAEQMFDYTQKCHIDEGRREFRPNSVEIGETLKSLFHSSSGVGFKQNRSEKDFVKIHFGLIISSPDLVKDARYKADVLRQAPNALAGEMEGASISEAIGSMRIVPKPQFITIKAVADWGTKDKQKCKGWKPFSAHAAAKFVHFRMNDDLAFRMLEQGIVD